MLTIFLGAGFGRTADLPLARNILDDVPQMDRDVRNVLARVVRARWHAWRRENHGTVEQYLAYLEGLPRRWGSIESRVQEWEDATKLVGLNIATRMGQVNHGNYQGIRHHDIYRTTGFPEYEQFWNEIFRRTTDVSVMTTNYDLLAERGIRAIPLKPGGKQVRPGFHYGMPGEWLAGSGPAFSSLRGDPVLRGSVPLMKLHGSVNWLLTSAGIKHYFNCWPAIYATPALVAPVENKSVPSWATPVWDAAHDALRQSDDLLFIGYSLPPYDHAVADLLQSSVRDETRVHIMDPNRRVTDRFRELLPRCFVQNHGSFPRGIRRFLSAWYPYYSREARSETIRWPRREPAYGLPHRPFVVSDP
ncbi:MAG: hypothetical protein QOE90_3494 [Thermoplasmata archaeon]|jgi:hypothetical protein|nr:hypothetical protein [Thermoplasmata archaeon]